MATTAPGAPAPRGVFARKPQDQIAAEAGGEDGLKRAVGVLDLTALGVGAIIGTAVIVLRRTQPDLERGFRVPLVPFFPIIGAGLCIYLMSRLDGVTWVRFGIWLAVGLVIYAAYGYRHSRLQRGESADTDRPLSA